MLVMNCCSVSIYYDLINRLYSICHLARSNVILNIVVNRKRMCIPRVEKY